MNEKGKRECEKFCNRKIVRYDDEVTKTTKKKKKKMK